MTQKLIKSQHIRMISGGSCDTEDWSNDAENFTLHHMNKLHFKIVSNFFFFILNCVICHNITVFTVCNQIKQPWWAQETSFKKILPTPNFWMVVYKKNPEEILQASITWKDESVYFH